MISPFTKPGEKIVCVDAQSGGAYSVGFSAGPNMHGLKKDEIYTVDHILPCEYAISGFTVCLREIVRTGNNTRNYGGFDLARFRYLHLPRSLTDLLETAPTRAPSELEPTQ